MEHWDMGAGKSFIQHRLDSTTGVRLTPDQKVGSSNLSRVIAFAVDRGVSFIVPSGPSLCRSNS